MHPRFGVKLLEIRVALLSSGTRVHACLITPLQLHAPACGQKPLGIRVALFFSGRSVKECVVTSITPCTRFGTKPLEIKGEGLCSAFLHF